MPKPRQSSPVETGGVFRSIKSGNTWESVANLKSYLAVQHYDEMRNHPTIAAGLEQIKAPIKATDWYISGKNKSKVEFLTRNIKRLWSGMIVDVLRGLEYGFAPFQKVFDVEDGKVYLKQMRALKPHYASILIDEWENFAGIVTRFSGSNNTIPRENSAVFTYNKEFNNLYGISRLRPARYPYVVHKYIMELCSMFYESFADPRYKVFVPEGKTLNPDTGKPIDNIAYVSNKIKSLHGGGAKHITLPAKKDGEAQYDIEVLDSSKDGQDYIAFLQYCDTLILQGILIPQDLVISSDRGSAAKQKEINSQFAFQYDSDMSQIKTFIETEILNPLIEYNFGKEDVGGYEWNYMPMTKKDVETLRNVFLAYAQLGKVEPDWDWLSHQIGIPINVNALTPEAPEETPAEVVEEDKPVNTPPAMSRCSCGHIHFEKQARELTTFEKRVDFERVKGLFEREPDFTGKLETIMDDMKSAYIKEAKKLINSGNVEGLNKLTLDYKNKYKNLYVKKAMTVLEDSYELVREELGLPVGTPADDIKKVYKARAENIAGKQLTDLEVRVKDMALTAVSTNQGFGEVENVIKNIFTDYKDTVKTGVNVTIQEFIDGGRREGASDPEVELAQWSAILDENVCPVCAKLDGNLVVKVGSDEYNKYTPSAMHFNCRCVWVYIMRKEENKPALNIPTVSQEEADKYIRKV